MSGPETRALVVSAPRGLLGFTWPAWSGWVLFSAVHLLGLVGGFAMNLSLGAGSAPSLISVPLAFSALAAAAATGQAIGVACHHVVAAPLAGALLFAVNFIGAGNVVPQVMRIGGATGSLVGLTWDAPRARPRSRHPRRARDRAHRRDWPAWSGHESTVGPGTS